MVSKSPFKITELFVFVGVGEDGEEGVLSFPIGNTLMPMVAADETRIKQLVVFADRVKQMTGRDYQIRRFFPAEPCDVTEQYK